MAVGESAMRMKEAGMRAASFFWNGNDRRQTDFISMSSVISPAPIASVRLTKIHCRSGYPDAAPQRSFLALLYSAAHPKHGMSAFAPLLGHSERRAPDQSPI